ncbi:hypothetical protein [Haloplanus halophilus]|uniref:hypothetical protein n=1 Tax=Haloplanus halophilus TaxID=2949993 RepID=UPI002040EE43|nr:hypothetical protein [Haloplanus sp. GDY1]
MNSKPSRGIVLIIALLLSTSAVGTAAAGTIPISQNDNGIVLTEPGGPSITLTGDTTMYTETGSVDSSTVQWNTTAGNASFKASGAAAATIDASSLDATTTSLTEINTTEAALTVRTGETPATTIDGGVTALEYYTAGETTLGDGQADFVYSASGSGSVTLRGLPANTEIAAATLSGTELGATTSDSSGTATISVSSATDAQVVLFQADAPTLSGADPADGAETNSYDGDISINVSDPDFATRQGDSVTVTATDTDGNTIGSQTVSSNGTVAFDYAAIPGPNTVEWTAADGYDNQDSFTHEFTTPSTLTLYNESAPSQVVDDAGELRVRFFGESDTVVTKSTADGTLNLTGVPANERFVVTVSDENDDYYYRRIIIDSIYEQKEIYLLPRSADANEVEFRLNDFTGGEFDAPSTRLYVERAITKDFNGDGSNTTQYQVVLGDTFGSSGGFPAVLATNERYRLRLVNNDGDVRMLGSYTPTRDAIEQLSVRGLSFEPPEGKGWTTNLNVSTEGRRSVTWKYIDESDATSSLNVSIRSSNGTVVYQDSVQDPGNYAVYGVPLDNETEYVVEWNATRGGDTIGQTRPVGGGDLGIDIPLDSDWLGTLGMLSVVFTLSLAGVRKSAYVAMSAVVMAGLLMALQAVNIYPPLWWLAALIAVGGYLKTTQRPGQ